MKKEKEQCKVLLTILILTILFPLTICAEKKEHPTFHREFSLYVDNDAILIASQFDKYYSSGIYFSYRRVLRPETSWFKLFNKRENLSKAIVSYSLEHRFYTASRIKFSEASDLDRPYAGWVDLAIGFNYHFKKNSVFRVKYDLGLLGPATQAEELQTWFHRTFGMQKPKGWEHQINNTLATNITASYQKRLLANKIKSLDIIYESSLQVGTVRNNIRTGLAIRMGSTLGDLDNSLFTRSKIGQERIRLREIPVEKRMQEFYLFYRVQQEYVIHNTTIDGGLIGAESAFTKESKPWVLHQEVGLGFGARHLDVLVSFHHRGREIQEAKNHQYVTMALIRRF